MPNKNDYLSDPDLTGMPWLASPFAESLIAKSSLPELLKSHCRDFTRDGYVTVDLTLPPDEIKQVIADMDKFADTEYQEHFYDKDADHPRYFDLWRKSEAVRNLACDPIVLDVLGLFYRRKPLPFQTINFKAASEQMAHSDFIHFAARPNGWVAGVAVYLEDTDDSNGPFMCYPGTHKLPYYHLNDIGLFNPSAANAREIYRSYEQFLQAIIEEGGFEMKEIHAPAGTAVIFDANILHGGAPVVDKNTTRLSQVTHYYFEHVHGHYCPLFSDSHASAWAYKDMKDKDILGHQSNEEV